MPRPECNRTTGTREPIVLEKGNAFTLSAIKARFDTSMNHIDGLGNIYNKMKEASKSDNSITNDSTQDLLRCQIVLMTSALDSYMHEISEYGVLNILRRKWNRTKAFKSFSISVTSLEIIWHNLNDTQKIKEQILYSINQMLQYSSFMKYKRIIEILDKLGISYPSEIQEHEKIIDEIALRRNKISHDFDRKQKNNQVEQSLIDDKIIPKYKNEIIDFVSIIHASVEGKTN